CTGRSTCIAGVQYDVRGKSGEFAGSVVTVPDRRGDGLDLLRGLRPFEQCRILRPAGLVESAHRLVSDPPRTAANELRRNRLRPGVPLSNEACPRGGQRSSDVRDVTFELDLPQLLVEPPGEIAGRAGPNGVSGLQPLTSRWPDGVGDVRPAVRIGEGVW